MGVIDEFKQEKNKKIIITASKKMIEDKYKMTINDNDLLIIINNIVSSICCDAILMKNIGKLIELNTIALTKIKDYIEKYIINKPDETLYQQETPIEIYFMGEIGEVFKSDSIKNLLPLSFDKNFL